MPTLDWIGKKAVVNHHREVPFHILKEDESLSFGKKDSGNLIVEGDNLVALKALLPYYKGKVKCIYIDPPYNTGNEGWVYNDNVNSPEIKKWLGQVVGKEMEDLSRHDKWLCMMYPRLSLLKEFLSDDGVIFISIDDNEQLYIRPILDEIFGAQNYANTIVWQSRQSVQNDTDLSINHEYIIAYAKKRRKTDRRLKESNLLTFFEKKEFAFLPIEVDITKYSNPDNDPRGLWKADPFDAPNIRPNLTYAIENPKTKKVYLPPVGRHWRVMESVYKKLLLENKIVFGKNGNSKPQLKVFYNEKINLGSVGTTWFSGDEVGTATEGSKELASIFGEKIGFDTPKPSRLIKKLIRLSSRKNDIILDSFAGSGTTAQAVLELNKEDRGNRKFILCEMLPQVAEPITRERAKRVIERDGLQEQTGFKFAKLGEPIYSADGDINPNIKYADLARHVFFMATGTPLAYNKQEFKTPLVGISNGVAIYLLYNGILGDDSVNGGNRLTQKVLKSLPKHDGVKIIYGTACGLSESVLRKSNIVFRQIPYSIFERQV